VNESECDSLAPRYLQFVLDTCQAQKLQIGLKALYYLAHLSLSIVDQGLGFGKSTKNRTEQSTTTRCTINTLQ